MNELMLKLMNEANKTANFNFTMEQAKAIHTLMETFGQLVVKECSDFVYCYPERYLTRSQLREICLGMHDHFGVNE